MKMLRILIALVLVTAVVTRGTVEETVFASGTMEAKGASFVKAELDALVAPEESVEVIVSTAQIALEQTKITAPTIVKLAELDKMVVKAEISEADVVHVKPAQQVFFNILAEPDHQCTATVRAVEPAPSEIESSDTISTDVAIYYNGLLEVDNPDHLLRIGMTAEVSIILDKAENVLTVPSSALAKAAGEYTVKLYDPVIGTIRVQVDEVGLNNKVRAELNRD